MKVRTGFVSNSSSSSFILYGRDMYTPDLIQIMMEKNATLFKELSGCADEQEAQEKFEEDWDGEIAQVFNKMDFGVDIDDYPGEEGNYMIGLQTDPECLDLKEVITGIWTQDQIDKVDAFFADTTFDASLDAGTKYC